MDIQALLGREIISTTQIYSHVGQVRMVQVVGRSGARQCLTSG